jgi:hypothetical protein
MCKGATGAKEDGKEHIGEVRYTLEANEEAWEYGNEGIEKAPCGDDKHKTKNGMRYFGHNHVNFAFPEGKIGITKGGLEFKITKDKVKAYWKGFYPDRVAPGDPPYIPGGDVNHKCNCFGYALSYDTWINDPTFIYKDDYEVQKEPATCDVIEIKRGGVSTHAVYITSTMTYDCKLSIGATSERNKESPTYYRTYLKGVEKEVPARFPSPSADSITLQRKKKA